MRRALRWLCRVVGLLAVVAAVGIVAVVTVLPSVVEGRAIAALADLGLTDVELDVRSISWAGADVTDIRIGPEDRLRIDYVRLDYHPRRLLERRIDRIEIGGLFFDARLREDRIDLGPVDRLRHGERRGDGGDIPFDEFVVRSSLLSLEVDRQTFLIPFEAAVDATGERLAFELSARPLHSSLRVDGDLDRNMNDLDLVVDGTLPDLNAWLERVPIAREPVFGTLTGGLEFSVRVQGTPAEVAADASLRAAGLGWHGVLGNRVASLTDLRLELSRLHGRFLVDERTGVLGGLELAANAPRVQVEGLPPWEVVAQVRSDGDSAVIELDARGLDGAADRATLSSHVEPLNDGVVRVTGPLDVNVSTATIFRMLPGRHATRLDHDGPGVVSLFSPVTAEVRSDGSSWRLELPGAEAHAELPRLTVVGLGVLEDVRCESSFRCELTPAGATVEIDDRSVVAADAGSFVDPCGAWEARIQGARAIRAELTRPVTIVAPPGGDDWRLDAPGWTMALHDGTLRTAGAGAALDGVTIELSGAVAAQPGGVHATLHAPSHASARTLRTRSPVVWTKVDPTTDLLRVECAEDAAMSADLGEEVGAWKLSAPNLRVRVAEGDVIAPTHGARLEGVALEWAVGVECTQDGGAVTTVGDGVISMTSGAATLAGTPVTLGPVATGLRPPENGELLRVDLSHDGATGGMRATALGTSVAAPGVGVAHLDRVDVEIAVSRSGDGLGATGRVTASASASSVDPADLPWSRLRTGVIDIELIARGQRDAGEDPVTSWDLGARAESRAGELIQVDAAGIVARCGSFAAETRSAGTTDHPPEVSGRLTLAEASVRHAERRLVMTDITADVPFALGGGKASRGRYDVGSIWFGDDYLSGPSGALAVSDHRLDVDLTWPLLGELLVTGSGFLEPGPRGPAGRLRLTVPRFEASPTTQPADLFQRLDGVELGGAFALDALIEIDGGRVEPTVTLTLDDVSVSSTAWDADIVGIDASITIDDLTPPATPGRQRISVARAAVGELVVEDGELVFRLEGPRSLFIERTAWRWAGGRLYSHAIRLDPQDPVLDFVLFADQLRLNDLASIVAPGKITGEGLLYGRLPLTIAWPELSYGEGYLYAEPGLGHIQVHDLGRFWLQVPKEARAALRDFEFAVLKARLEDAGEAKIRLRGTSRDPAYPREVILDVNVHGFDRLLDTAIIVTRLSSADAFPR